MRARVPPLDRGSGTLLVLALLALVAGLAGFAAAVGGAVTARHRAEAAADLAALAAASGPVAVADCGRAREVAHAGGAVLTGCRALDDGSVAVEVVVMARVPVLAHVLPARARARAGPPPGAGSEPQSTSADTSTGVGSGLRGRMCTVCGRG